MLHEKVLYILEQNRGQIVTGGSIAMRLGVSRTAVWKAIAALREAGNDIQSIPNSGYRLSPESDGLCAAIIGDYLDTRMFGRSMEILHEIDSTNTYLCARDTSVLPEGHTVLAHHQTRGKGRLGRPFACTRGGGIYMSILLKPRLPVSEAPFITICAAVAVVRAIEDVCGAIAGIKWVNDIYLSEKKLCGILTEASVTAEVGAIDRAVVGIGINTGEVPLEVQGIATSIYEHTGKRGIRGRLIAAVLTEFETIYLDYSQNGKKKIILDEYCSRLFVLGRQVEVSEHGRVYSATVLGIDDCGCLIVKLADGEIINLNAGEINLI